MGVPTLEVGYTSAMPRREDGKVHKDMWGHWKKKLRKVPEQLVLLVGFICALFIVP